MSKNKHKSKKRPRIEAYHSKVSNPELREVTIKIDQKSGELSIEGADKNSGKLVTSYIKDSGKEKILSMAPTQKMASAFGLMANIRMNFDVLIAIDTNTNIMNGNKISITTSFFTPSLISSNLNAELLSSWISFDCIDSLNPERLGWHLVIKYNIIQKKNPPQKIGIIVDSELGLIDLINKREIPYYADNLLPDNVQLLYASETETGSFPNEMIKCCDYVSREVFEQIKQPEFILPTPRNSDQYHKGHLNVVPNVPE